MDEQKKELSVGEEVEKFVDLVSKARKGNADPADLREIKNTLDEVPEFWHIGKGFAGNIFDQLIASMEPSEVEQLILKAEATDIKTMLGYNKANQLEKLIIDEIMLCWTHENQAHMILKNITFDRGEFSRASHKHWQNNVTQCQKRYLRAIETLARVRKMNINVQFNIATNGGKQVNVNST